MLFSPRSLLSETMSLGQSYHIIVFGLNSYYLIIVYFVTCIAIPFSIELKIDINNQTMLQLKKQII